MDRDKIKYRCWTGTEMWMVDSLEFMHHRDTAYLKEFSYYCHDKHYPVIALKDAILMQYIGYNDKDGKEIFEHDIVEVCRGDELYLVYIEDIRQLHQWLFGSSVKWLKVLGNVHENPEELPEDHAARRKYEKQVTD